MNFNSNDAIIILKVGVSMKRYTTADRLKQIISQRNIKQTDILEAAKPYCQKYNIKLNKSDLSQFVNGKVTPGQWKLTVLALALNVSEAWLMGLDVPMERQEIYKSEDVAKNIAALEAMSDSELDEEFRRLYDLLEPDEKDMIRASIEGIINAKKKKE